MVFSTFVFCVFLFICFFFIRILLSLSNKIKEIEKNRKALELKLNYSLEESLELATAEQLLKQLRLRKNMPFVLLLPIKEKDFNGITIESHGISSSSSLAMLHLARAITIQNIKENGLELPKLPPLNDFFE